MRTGIRNSIVTSVVTIVVLATTAASSGAVADFRTPGRAAYCGTSHSEGRPWLICWTPNDGFTTSMSPRGRSSKSYNPRNKGYHDVVGRVLRFGQRIRLAGAYTCVSRRNGLTCTNSTGNGWWLGRYVGYRML